MEVARTGRNSRPNCTRCLISAGGRHEGPGSVTITWQGVTGGQIPRLGGSGTVSHQTPTKGRTGSFHLFIFYRKTCSSPSLLIINICLDSRIWPRIESWLASAFMTQWPSFYLEISCFSCKAGDKQLNQNCPAWKDDRDSKGKEKRVRASLRPRRIPFPALFRQFYIMGHIRARKQPEGGQGRVPWRSWILAFTLSDATL